MMFEAQKLPQLDVRMHALGSESDLMIATSCDDLFATQKPPLRVYVLFC